MIKAIIFDFDGTLANSFTLGLEIYKKLWFRCGSKIPANLNLNSLKNLTYQQIAQTCNINKYNLLPIILQLKILLLLSNRQIKLFDGIATVMQELQAIKSIKLGLLTSGSKSSAKQILLRSGIKLNFYYSQINLFNKHKALLKICQKYSLQPREVLYVGDEVRDIEACAKINMPILACSWGFLNPNQVPNYSQLTIINKPEEILEIVNTN